MVKIINKIADILLAPFTKGAGWIFFVFLYILGIVENFGVLPNWENDGVDGFQLFIDLYVLAAIVALLPQYIKRFPFRATIKGVIYFIAYTLAIVDVFCFTKFGSGISASILLLVGETTGSETAEFFTTYVTPDVLLTEVGWIFLVLIAHITVSVLSIFHFPLSTFHFPFSTFHFGFPFFGRRPLVPLSTLSKSLLSLSLIIVVFLGWPNTWNNKRCMVRHFSCQTIGDVEKDMNLKPCFLAYQPIYKLADAIFSNELISRQLGRLKSGAQAIEESAGIAADSTGSRNIILIIGESCNKHHFQLYGYEKPTTPRQVEMEKTGRLTKFTDVIAPWNLTSFVFKHLMTTYCVGDDKDWCDYPLFCQLFRKAGYHVSFLTNQFLPHAKDAIYDFSGGFFINDELLSKAQFDTRNEETHLWDEDLLKDYNRLVAPIQPSLTIFHLMGQHVNYRIRCPKSKHKFFASDYEHLTQNTPKERKNIAYYDCATWYNDSVVGAIVDRFKDKDAIIIYLSDHGEEVYGPGSLHHCGRNHTTNITRNMAEQEYEIPMWIYCTDRYKQSHPETVAAVKAAANKPFMTDALSHVLLGLAGIKDKYYRPQFDLLCPLYDTKRQRLMQHIVDYDKVKKAK